MLKSGNGNVYKQNLFDSDIELIVATYSEIFLIKNNGASIGYILLSPQNYFEISIIKKMFGRGISIHATILLLDYLFVDKGLSKIFTSINRNNSLSLQTASRFGWEFNGYDNDWVDMKLTKKNYLRSQVLSKLRLRYIIAN